MFKTTLMFLIAGMLSWIPQCAEAVEEPSIPRSNGCVLNVDYENYTDGVVQALNAGVRWLGDPFAERNEGAVEITRGFAFLGSRCAYVETAEAGQIGRIRLQGRFDAPVVGGDVVSECVFRPSRTGGAVLDDFTVWSPIGGGGLIILANSDPENGMYRLDVLHGPSASGSIRTDSAVARLNQREWTRIVMHRKPGTGQVDLWAGFPEREVFVGSFPDLDPNSELVAVEIGDTSEQQFRGSGFWDDMRIGGLLAAGEKVAPPEPPLRDLRKEAPIIDYPFPVGCEKQLFADDAVIESLSGLQRTFHPSSKHPGNPLLLPEEPWEKRGPFFVPFSVIREDPAAKLRLWYGAYDGSRKTAFTCVAESDDGIQWSRPHLGIFEFEGSKDNNIVWMEGRAVKPNYDPHDSDVSRRYKGMMRTDGFTPMFSPDGLHWTKAAAPAINQAYDATSFHWDPVREKWIASCKIFRDGKRARGYAESEDYTHWSDTGLLLSADDRDDPQDHLYAMRIARYESVYIGLLKVYHVSTDHCDIQLAFSRNAKCWDRPFRTPFISNSPERGACDYGNLDEAGDPIRMGDELWFYYGGRNVLHEESPENTSGSLCLAKLRLDGFVSLDAGAEEGTLLTKPLLLRGNALFLNADAAEGEIRVEIAADQPTDGPDGPPPIAPFTLAACAPITGDSVRHAVRWTGGTGLKVLDGTPVRLRFSMRNARLYAFWSE